MLYNDQLTKKQLISIIVAVDTNRAIGKKNALLWHIPDDLKRFKALTTGHPIIMGRKTFESIGRPLPNRTNIVITRDKSFAPEGVTVCHTLEEAISLAKAKDEAEIFIIGGGQIYEQALPLADRIYLTLVDKEFEADTFFPDYSQFNKKINEQAGSHEGLNYRWLVLEK